MKKRKLGLIATLLLVAILAFSACSDGGDTTSSSTSKSTTSTTSQTTTSSSQTNTSTSSSSTTSTTSSSSSVTTTSTSSTQSTTSSSTSETTTSSSSSTTSSTSATPAREEFPTTYQYTITFYSSSGSSGAYKIWVKNEKIRLEITMDDQGDQAVAIVIFDGSYQYLYMPEVNMAYKYPLDSDATPAAGFDGYAEYFTDYYTVYNTDAEILAAFQSSCMINSYCQSVEITGHESIGGQDCTIFEMTYTDGTITRMWIATDKGHVLKVENEIGGETSSIEFSNIDFDSDIPDSTFEIPSGTQILDM